MDHTKGYTKAFTWIRWACRLPAVALVLSLAAALGASSPAARGANSFEVFMSSDYTLLMNPTSTVVHSMVQQEASTAANTANNNPVIDIKNTSSTASIKEVQFTLTDPDSVFDALGILKGPSDAQKRFGTTGPFATMIWGARARRSTSSCQHRWPRSRISSSS